MMTLVSGVNRRPGLSAAAALFVCEWRPLDADGGRGARPSRAVTYPVSAAMPYARPMGSWAFARGARRDARPSHTSTPLSRRSVAEIYRYAVSLSRIKEPTVVHSLNGPSELVCRVTWR